MKLLIDTHAFLWLASDISKLSPKVQHLFSDDANEIYLSVASLWEMAIKIGLGKLQVAKPLATLVAEQQQANRIQLLLIQPEHTLAVQDLPHYHKDPFDRMLVVQAKAESLTLVTQDGTLSRYLLTIVW